MLGTRMLTSRFQQRSRILCWIMTTLDNHQSKAFHVKTTWGKHCDLLVFMSDASGNVIKRFCFNRRFRISFGIFRIHFGQFFQNTNFNKLNWTLCRKRWFSDDILPAVNLKVGKGRQFLWAKTGGGFQYVYANYRNEYDWVIKADDDT